MKWIDWYTDLINFLRVTTGRNGLPLSYLCRHTNVQVKDIYNYFINEYVDKLALVGHAFTTDKAKVYTYILRFTSGNTVAETKMVAHAAENKFRLDFMALKDSYEVIGVHTVNVVKSNRVLDDFFYSDENKSHMWWGEFERQITKAFNTYNNLEKKSVCLNDMRLRILNRNIL